jgi:hypothetical protein
MPGRAAAPPVLTCAQDTDETYQSAEIVIRNRGPATVPAGAAIIYRLRTGETGTVAADGMAPGSADRFSLSPRRVEPRFTCTASLR